MVAIEFIVVLSSKTSFNNFSRKMLGDFTRGTVSSKVNNVMS